MSNYQTTRIGTPDTHTWEDKPEYRDRNDGFGDCNTGSGKRMVCSLGGIGCDVDHMSVAKKRMATA